MMDSTIGCSTSVACPMARICSSVRVTENALTFRERPCARFDMGNVEAREQAAPHRFGAYFYCF